MILVDWSRTLLVGVKSARGLRKQVYMIYDFLQSTSNPQAWLEESFLKGFEKADFTVAKENLCRRYKGETLGFRKLFPLPFG